MKRKFTFTLLGILSLLLPSVVLAQEYGIPRIAFEERAQDSESQIVIRVRNANDRANLCGSKLNLSQFGTDDYDFPRPGRSTSYDFPKPNGSINHFQLPVGAKDPEIIGCVDTRRNIVFINILKPQPQAEAQKSVR